MYAARSHGFDLSCIGLNDEVSNLFARYVFHVCNEICPGSFIYSWIFNRRVNKIQCVWVDPFTGIGRRISYQIAVTVTESAIQGSSWAILGHQGSGSQ